ncbi:MAG: ABC transporter ATP-binding protein [Armatimonadetes bacterium]|nr:ABC transporter ATP-binding protein [Armatimonadota bacterium]
MARRIDPRFVAQLKRQRKPLVAGLLCAAGASLLTLLTVFFLREVIGAVLHFDSRLLALLSLSVIALFSVKYWFTRGQIYYLMMAAHRLTADMRKQIFDRLQSLPMAFFNEKRVGSIQSVLTNDVMVIQNGVALVRDVVTGPMLVVGGIATLFILSWQLALVSLVALPPVAYAIRTSAGRVRRAQHKVQHELGNMTAMMQESLSNVRIVKSFSAEKRETERFDDHVEMALASNMRVVRRLAALRPLIELIGAAAVAAVIWVGGVLVADGRMSPESLLAFALALDYIVRGATGVGNLANNYSQVLAATDRVYREVLDVESDIEEDKDAITPPEPQGRVEFRNVSFTYPDGTEALKNVSFVVEPGKSTALVGRSGSGKTTIADLLLRFYDPTEGHISFDGIDIRDLKTDWLRRQIGVVSQQTLLFATTVGANISFGKPDATQEEIERAAQLAHADEFVKAMPNGYNTVLGERGVRLSGGEMQRVAIARALLVDPTVLLLDEATSSLDAVSEQKVQAALDQIMKERTTLLIAHRLTTAARADQILVISNGEIVERGSHTELMAVGGAYAIMYRAFGAGVFEETLD